MGWAQGYSRGRWNGCPIVRNAILALSDKWLSLDTRPMDEQIIIAQMSFINLRQVHIWFRTSADAMLLVRRTSASQIPWQPLGSDYIAMHWTLVTFKIVYRRYPLTPHSQTLNDWDFLVQFECQELSPEKQRHALIHVIKLWKGTYATQ